MILINSVLLKAGILKDIAKSPLPDFGVQWFEHVTKGEMILAGIIILIIIVVAIILKSRYNRWREKSQIINTTSSIDDEESDTTTESSESTIASIDRIISSGKGLEYINALIDDGGSDGADGDHRDHREYGEYGAGSGNVDNGFDPRIY